jgi:hypothetical protein
MFPIKRIEQLHQELQNYYLQVIAFQDEDSQYKDIIPKLSRTISELDSVIEDMRKYNNNTNDQIINLNNK